MHFEILGQERKDKKPFNPCLLRHKDKHLVIVSRILLWLKLLLTFVKISRRCFFVSPYQQEEQLEDRRYHGNIYNIVVKSENIKSIG